MLSLAFTTLPLLSLGLLGFVPCAFAFDNTANNNVRVISIFINPATE